MYCEGLTPADLKAGIVKARRMPRVALLVETSLSSGQDILLGIGQYLRERGPWAVYAQPHDLSQPPPGWFRGWRGDGIVARLQNQRILEAVEAKGVPVVDVLGVRRHPRFPLVHVDNRAIAEMGAEHLLDRGFTQFAFVGLADEYWSAEREQGFVQALAARGRGCAVMRLTRRAYERTAWADLVRGFAQWLGRLPLPVGVMMCSDVQALLVREACQAAGLVVGSNIALLGVGNDRTLCEMSSPQLSSVEANHVQVGYEAAALLDRLMRGGKPPAHPVLVKPYYVAIRESTDFLAVNDPAVAKALHFIRLHCDRSLQLDDVAREAGLSRSVLQRRFRALINRTVLDEITDARLHRAQELLRQTDRPLEEIAEHTGFGYVQNMGRVFRKHLGKTPGQFRRRPGSERRGGKAEAKARDRQ